MVVDPSSGNMSFPRENILSREKVGRADSVQRGSPFFLLDLFFLSCNFVRISDTRSVFGGRLPLLYYSISIRNSKFHPVHLGNAGGGTIGDNVEARRSISRRVPRDLQPGGSRRTRGELVAPLPIPRSTSCFAREQGRGNESEAERGVIQFYKSPLLFSPPRYFE